MEDDIPPPSPPEKNEIVKPTKKKHKVRKEKKSSAEKAQTDGAKKKKSKKSKKYRKKVHLDINTVKLDSDKPDLKEIKHELTAISVLDNAREKKVRIITEDEYASVSKQNIFIDQTYDILVDNIIEVESQLDNNQYIEKIETKLVNEYSKCSLVSLPPVDPNQKDFDEAGSDFLPNYMLDGSVSRTHAILAAQASQGLDLEHKKLIKWAKLDRDLMKFSATRCVTKQINIPWAIRMLCKYRVVWESFVFILSLATYAFITYSCFFGYFEEKIWFTVFIIDVIFGFDVLLRLGIEIWRHTSVVPGSVLLLPYSVEQSILDVLALIPIERSLIYFTKGGVDSLTTLNYVDLMRFNRFLRFGRVFKFFSVMKLKRYNAKFMFVLEYMTWYLAFIHFIACVFFLLLFKSPLDYLLNWTEDKKPAWITQVHQKPGIDSRVPSQQYLISMGFSTATVTTVGFGDFFAIAEDEMVVCIVVMLIGAIVLTGNFSSILATFELETDGARFDIFHRAEAIQRYLVTVKIAPLLRKKVEEYYNHLWNFSKGVYDVEMFHHLPTSLQEDVLYDISQEMFHKSSFFRDLDESFLRAVSRIVRVNLLNSNMIICETGNYAVNMFYIIQGEVNIRSRLNRECISCILRAGSIIGEVNLFYSCPYDVSFETRSACQVLQIRKQDLMELFKDYNDELHIMRERVQNRLKSMRKVFTMEGKSPIIWVERNEDCTPKEQQIFEDHPVEMRWYSGFNPKVTHDVPNDTLCPIIVEQKVRSNSREKNHNICFETCMIPPILTSEYEWVRKWNLAIMTTALVYGFLGPYCFVFGATSEFDMYLQYIESLLQFPILIIYTIDVLVEIGTACPVTGIYFKMRDGFRVRMKQFLFWLDVAAAFPYSLLINDGEDKSLLRMLPILVQSLKMWKVVRYLKFKENIHPKRIFWFRLLHTILVLLYGIHFIACSLFFTACPTNEYESIFCKSHSWMASYSIFWKTGGELLPKDTVEELASEMPYLLSFFYACATLTSAGFGDFNPKTNKEIIWSIIFQLIGFLLIGYYTSILTSALACIVRPTWTFQQKLSTVVQFMDHHGLSEGLKDRVSQYYRLQHQLTDGIILPQHATHLMYDAPKNFTDDILLQEVELFLDGVPIFTKTDSKVLIKIAEKMQRFIVPTNTIVLRRGECRRTLFIVIKGSVAVTNVENTDYKDIIEASGHFGLRDLLYGEPSTYNIRTLSDCFMWSIDYDNFQNAFAYEEETLDWVVEERAKMTARVEAMQQIYDSYDHSLLLEDVYVHVPSWNILPHNKFTVHERCTYEEYMKPYKRMRKINQFFLKFFLMSKTVHPSGTFAKLWTCFISCISVSTLIFLLIEHLSWYRHPTFRILQWIINLVNYMDIFIKMHWGYFSENNVLIMHPVKTAVRYISKGSFFHDAFYCFPFELVIVFLGGTNLSGYGPGATWFSVFRWTRLFQVFRIPIIFNIAHSTFKMRTTVLVTLYVLMTAGFCTAFTSIAVYLGCPFPLRDWQDGDEHRLPLCLPNTLMTTKPEIDFIADLDAFWERWMFGIYYVTQVVLVIGYGDMIKLNRGELYLMVVMMVFGFIITRCIIADITASAVDNDLTRDLFTGSMNTLLFIMEKEKVHWKFVKSVKIYFYHTWLMTKSYQPTTAFSDLNFELKAELFQEFIGERISTVPLFEDLSPCALRALCTNFSTMYCVRGQHIARFGNLEYDLIVFTKGIIWLLDKNSDYLMNLYPGETFGEVGMMYLLPRKFSVLAGSSVEALTLSPQAYLKLIECYPSIKRSFEEKLKKYNFRNLFEAKLAKKKIEWANMAEAEMKHENEDKRKKTEYIRKVINAREPPYLTDQEMTTKRVSFCRRTWKKIYRRGPRDNALPFFYLATDDNLPPEENTFLIHPNCSFMDGFTEWITWYCYISSAMTLYIVCFPCDKCELLYYSLYTEIAMVVFIILQFFTPFQTDEMSFCKYRPEIISNYVFSPSLFMLDFIGTLPYGLLEIMHVPQGKYFALIKLIRLVRFYREMFKKQNVFSVTTFRYRITISVASFFLMAHVLACLFYFISACEEMDEETFVCQNHTWTRDYVSKEGGSTTKSSIQWYLVSLYWVVTTVSTTGFGDLTPVGLPEMGIAVITIFCGAFLLSLIMSDFAAGFSSRNKTLREFVYEVKLLLSHTRNIGLSSRQQENIVSYFRMVWDGCRGQPYNQSTAVLPSAFRVDICYTLYSKCVKKARIFGDMNDNTFIAQVCSRLTHSMYQPGITIVTQGDLGDSLYIVYRGKVAAYARNFQGKFKVTRGYTEGNIFGVIPALFFDQDYSNSYRAETVVEILKLSQSDIYLLASNYPKFSAICQNLILGKALTRGVKLADCIFSEGKSSRRGLFELDARRSARVQESETLDNHEMKKRIIEAATNLEINMESKHKLDEREGLMAKPTKSRVKSKKGKLERSFSKLEVREKKAKSTTKHGKRKSSLRREQEIGLTITHGLRRKSSARRLSVKDVRKHFSKPGQETGTYNTQRRKSSKKDSGNEGKKLSGRRNTENTKEN